MTVDSQAPSMVAVASGSAAACPAIMHLWQDRARMAAEGSTAATLMPYQLARVAAHRPVPAPRSSVRMPGRGARWRATAVRHSLRASGGSSRDAWKAAAAASS